MVSVAHLPCLPLPIKNGFYSFSTIPRILTLALYHMAQGLGGSVGRRRGAVGGAGELETVGGGEAKAKSPSTFWRLWSEAKHEKGNLALAGVCLLASSSANLMAPAIMAK